MNETNHSFLFMQKRSKISREVEMMGKKWTRLLLASLFLLVYAGAVQAEQWANPGLLVDVETVKANIDKPDWVVVDARDLKDYAKGHIPGAISLGKRGKKALRDSTSRVFNDVSKYEKLLGKVGIGNDTHVVLLAVANPSSTLHTRICRLRIAPCFNVVSTIFSNFPRLY